MDAKLPQFSPLKTPGTKVLSVILAFVSVCVFLNAIQHGFVYDDIGVIEDNYFVRSLSNLPRLLGREYFQLSHELTYRPVVTLSYMLDYALWQLNPFGYHLTNVVLHAASVVTFFLLMLRLVRTRATAVLAAVLFSIHPCVTEAVNAVGYREDVLAALFCFLSCLCLSLSRRWVYYPLSLFAYALALFSKETALVAPLFMLLYWVICLRNRPPFFHTPQEGVAESGALPTSLKQEPANPSIVGFAGYLIRYYLGYAVISVCYVWVRFVAMKNPQEHAVGYIKGSVSVNFMTMAKVLASYVKLMFLPFHLSADYQMSPALTVFDAPFLASAALLVVAGTLFFIAIRTATVSNEARGYGLFMACFFTALLPVMNIVPIGHFMAERFLYLPSAGFCAILGMAFCGKSPRCTQYRVSGRFFVLPLMVITCVFFTTRTVLRNGDWLNEYTFWTKILEEQPKNFDARNNLGNYFYKQGMLDRAVLELEEAVKLKPDYPEGRNSLGTVYLAKGLIDKAIAEYLEAIRYKPVFPQAYYNLGNACIKKGMVDRGIACFQNAIVPGMNNPQVFNNLGSAYMKKGMVDEAIAQYQRALSVYKDFAEAHSNLGYVYTVKGDLSKASSELEAALRLQPGHANAHNNLGAVYSQMGLWDKALDEFLQAVALDPKNASAHKNLGMIYFKNGNKQKAREHLFQMLKCDPQYIGDAGIYSVIEQLGMVRKE